MITFEVDQPQLVEGTPQLAAHTREGGSPQVRGRCDQTNDRWPLALLQPDAHCPAPEVDIGVVKVLAMNTLTLCKSVQVRSALQTTSVGRVPDAHQNRCLDARYGERIALDHLEPACAR